MIAKSLLHIQAANLVSALLTAQAEINKTCNVKIGIGAHFGEYYHINGGLYGEEADAIEEFAENETEGGEVLITQSIYQMLPADHGFEIVKKREGGIFSRKIFESKSSRVG